MKNGQARNNNYILALLKPNPVLKMKNADSKNFIHLMDVKES